MSALYVGGTCRKGKTKLMTNTGGSGTIGGPWNWEEIAMKASSLFVTGLFVAILATAPGNAAQRNAAPPENDWGGCSSINWPSMSLTPCKIPGVTTYAECRKYLLDRGTLERGVWWVCSSGRYKS
jgi:hypothetical protein